MKRGLMTLVLAVIMFFFAVALFRNEFVILLSWKALVFLAVALHLYALVNMPYFRIGGAKFRWIAGRATEEDRELLRSVARQTSRVIPAVVVVGWAAVALTALTRLGDREFLGSLAKDALCLAAYGAIIALATMSMACEEDEKKSRDP